MFSAGQLDGFLKTEFTKRIADDYRQLKILTEGDLQVRTWFYLRRFLKRHDASRSALRILNRPFCKDLRTFPDLAIYKGDRPGALIELKKICNLKVSTWVREKSKLLQAYEVLDLERCYLIWAARYGRSESVMDGDGAEGVFLGVPIILEDILGTERVRRLEPSFKRWRHFAAEEFADRVPKSTQVA